MFELFQLYKYLLFNKHLITYSILETIINQEDVVRDKTQVITTSSDTNYVEWGQVSQVKCPALHKTVLSSDTS